MITRGELRQKRRGSASLLRKGNSYEKEIDLQTPDSVGRKREKRFGNRVLRALRSQRDGIDLAICGANDDTAPLISVATSQGRVRSNLPRKTGAI